MGFPWMFKSEQLLGTIERVTTFVFIVIGGKRLERGILFRAQMDK